MRTSSLLFLLGVSLILSCNGNRGGSDKPANPGDYLAAPKDRVQVTNDRIEDPAGPKQYPLRTFQGQTWLGVNLMAVVKDSWCYQEQGMNCADFGRLYTASAARFACKSLGPGWRLTTLDEWKDLLRAYGGYIGEDRKPKGKSPEAALLNLTNPAHHFDLTIGGLRTVEGQFTGQDIQTFYWTSTEAVPYKSYYALALEKKGVGVRVTELPKEAGGYCRCVKD